MLPSLGKLSLAPDPTPMGTFYELSEPEAAELNANGGREPLTFDDYKPNRARGQEGATFRLYWDQKRVLRKPPGHRSAEELEAHGQSLYAVYDARALWDWAKTHEKDPTGSFQISYEDWMQLYAEFGNFGPIPEFVSKLPSVEWPDFGPNTVWTYEESGVGKRLKERWTGGTWSATVDGALRFDTYTDFTANSQKPGFLPTDGIYYSGPPGEERIIKARYGKSTDYLTGPPGREQIYKTVTSKGFTRFYATDEEPRASRYHRPEPEYLSERARGRLEKIVSPDGLTVWHYTGPKKHERLVYSEADKTSATGNYTWVEQGHFTGRRGMERMYKVVRFQRGQYGSIIDTHYLRGAKRKEHAYKRVAESNENWVAYYETGEEQKGALRRVESVRRMREGDGGSPSSNYSNTPGPYEGPVYTRTGISYFEGPRGAETFVRNESTITGPDGVVGSTETELPEEDPDRRERAQRFYNYLVRKYSAWAGVWYLVEPDNPVEEEQGDDLE